jgi:hypothetical protein
MGMVSSRAEWSGACGEEAANVGEQNHVEAAIGGEAVCVEPLPLVLYVLPLKQNVVHIVFLENKV